MKSVPVFTLGALPVFSVPVDEPGYWSERLCYELSHSLNDMAAAGMTNSIAEESDFSTFDDEVSAFLSSFRTWVSAAYDRSNSRALVQPMTAIVPVVSSALALASGGGSVLVPLLLRVGIQILCEVVAGQANNLLDGDSGSLEEVVDVLGRAFLRSENETEAQSLLAGSATGALPDVAGLGDVLARALLNVVDEGGGNMTVSSFLQEVLTNFNINIDDAHGRTVNVSCGGGYQVEAP